MKKVKRELGGNFNIEREREKNCEHVNKSICEWFENWEKWSSRKKKFYYILSDIFYTLLLITCEKIRILFVMKYDLNL